MDEDDDRSFDETELFFDELDQKLESVVDPQFFKDPKRFKSILEVIDVIGQRPIQTSRNQSESDFLANLRESSPAYAKLIKEQNVVIEVIESVVKFQHGGLNNSVDAMGDVISSYKKSQELIKGIRGSLVDIRGVMSPVRPGQLMLRELWERKRLLEEQIRLLDEFEELFDATVKIQKLSNQKRFISAVKTLNHSIESMFSEDMVSIEALSGVRNGLMDEKEVLIDKIVTALKEIILGMEDLDNDDSLIDIDDNASSSEYESEIKSEKTKSIYSSMTSGDKDSLSKNLDYYKNDNWPINLQDVTEELEMSLPDPTTSTSLYIRFLVKAVNSLGCEDDIEKMILEQRSEMFHLIVNKIKKKILSKKIIHKTDDKSHIRRFHSLVSNMLSCAFLILKKILYIIKLISINKKAPNNGGKLVAVVTSESTKKMIISLWKSIEEIIIDVLNMHYVELDVQDISNEVKGDPNSKFYVSEKAPAGESLKDIFSVENANEKEDLEKSTVCPPTVRLSAGVFKEILSFTDRVVSLFREELDPEIDSKTVSNVLVREQYIIERELMPVIQSIVNKEIRDMQTSGHKYFSPNMSGHDSEIGRSNSIVISRINFETVENSEEPAIVNQTSSSSSGVETNQYVCLGSISCVKTVRPLLNYWIHLPQHREHLVTIIERFFLGYSAASRQELETVNWKMHSVNKKYFLSIIEIMKLDPLFKLYKFQFYNGKSSVDDLLNPNSSVKDSSTSATAPTSLPIEKKNLSVDSTQSNISKELDIWVDFWDVNQVNYPLNNNEITNDFKKIQTLASIAYSADWLANKLSKRFNHLSKKFSYSIYQSNSNIGIKKSTHQELIMPLKLAFLSGFREFSKLSEESTAILRGELQLACFHYLHLVAKLDFSNNHNYKNNIKNKKRVMDGRPEPEALIGAWNQYIASFQDAILVAADPSFLCLIFSPLCYLAPRILMRCMRSLFESSFKLTSEGQEIKTKLLRAILACQQGLSMLFESSNLESSSNKLLQSILNEEFCKIRKFVQLLGCLTAELRLFVSQNGSVFTKEELNSLWQQTKDRGAQEVLQDFMSSINR